MKVKVTVAVLLFLGFIIKLMRLTILLGFHVGEERWNKMATHMAKRSN